jgi:hypothetical protein
MATCVHHEVQGPFEGWRRGGWEEVEASAASPKDDVGVYFGLVRSRSRIALGVLSLRATSPTVSWCGLRDCQCQ